MSETNENWDVIIVGGGAAGLSAALTLGRACRRVLVLDAGEPRNRFAAHVHGVLGHEGVEPGALLERGRDEVRAYDVTVRPGTVRQVTATDDGVTLALADGGTAVARALIVASGLSDELPEVPGLAEQWGTGVLHCPYCHGWEVRGGRLGVLGTSPVSLHQVELVRQWSDRLTFFTAACGPLAPATAERLRSRGVELVEVPVAGIISEGGRLTGVRLADGGQVALDAVFTAPTSRPHDGLLAGLDLARTESPMGSFLAVDPTGRTAHPRIWAVGNVVDPAANVAMCIGAGSRTGGAVNAALVAEEFDRAVTAGAGRRDDHGPGGDHRADGHGGDGQGDEASPVAYWEGQYAERPRRWSGRVNPTTAEVVRGLGVEPGAALDLGCGEGGDALWLAGEGWQVTAVDISATAVARGAEAARAEGLGDRITWVDHDLATWRTEASFDLVTASFLHSTVELARTEILRRAAGRLRPGGHLLIVSHVFERPEDVPPWARRHHGVELDDRLHVLLTPAEEVAELALGARWEVVAQEVRTREATGPDGHETATVKDGVVLLRRRPSA